MSGNLLVGGGFCLQFVTNATSVKHSKVKRNKMGRAGTLSQLDVKELSKVICANGVYS